MTHPRNGKGVPVNSSAESRPASAWVVSLILLGQAAALLVSAALLLINLQSATLGIAAQLFLLFLILLAAFWIGSAGVGVLRGQAWVRAATLIIEIFAIVLSINYFTFGDVGPGLALMVPAVIALVLLFSPALNGYIRQRRAEED